MHVDGPALVLAGAGSGKTRVLAERVCNLVKYGKARSYEILALTFTNKAAEEMKARINSLLGKRYDFPWVGTFHSICFRLLRENIRELRPKYKTNFTIYDPSDQNTVMKRAIEKLEFDLDRYNSKSIRTKLDSLKNDYTNLDELVDNIQDENELNIMKLYQSILIDNNAMDFGDLLVNFYELIHTNEGVKKKLHKRFKYILVDEYQDTNRIQFRILTNLVSETKNLFVVGDEDQSIYGWRGASIENFFDFEKIFPKSKIFKLEQNYRSTPQILEISNELIKNNEKRKYEKKLTTNNPSGEPVEIHSHYDNAAEAEFVCKKILKYTRKKDYTLNNFGIFYRTNFQSRMIEDELRKNNIPYTIVGNISFYERKEIKDIIAFLRLLDNPFDELSFDRVINLPPRGIGLKTLEKIKLKKDKWTYLDFLINHSPKQEVLQGKIVYKLEEFGRLLKELYCDMKESDIPMAEALEKFLTNLKYYDYLDDEDRKENVNEFLNIIAEYEEKEASPNLYDFLNTFSLRTSVDNFDQNEKRVVMMTVHLAKGLEFPCVFMVGMEEGLFPHSRSLNEGESQTEEERRLCYVAFTRAMKKLHISYCRMRRQFGTISICEKSQFIDEIQGNINVKIIEPEDAKIYKGNKTQVYHYRFGSGIILKEFDENIDDIITVLFDSGITKRVFISDLDDI